MTSRNPVRLTVALLTFNRLHYLREAVAGILAQTYRDFEFLILDNGSTDGTARFILDLDDPRIRYVRNPRGTSIEFNSVSGYHIARGERVLVTHDDDIMEPEMLAEQMAFMDAHPEVKLVWCNVTRIDHSGSPTEPDAGFSGQIRIFPPGAYIENFLTERLWPTPSTVLLERGLVATRLANRHYFQTSRRRWKASNADVGGMDDVEIPAFVNTRHTIAFIDRPLFRYRVHPAQGTNAVDLSKPSIYLYMTLRNHARRVQGKRIDEHLFDSHLMKHRLQQTLSTNRQPSLAETTRRTIRRYLLRAFGDPARSEDARTIALPIRIAAQLATGLALPARPLPPYPAELPSAMKAFHDWASAVSGGRSIFTILPRERNIILFGSALVAALLIMDARLHGYRIIACIDSNIHRQNDTLFGVDILPPAWLHTRKAQQDLVVLTSEKDQEAYLERLVHDLTQGELEILSWKSLANTVAPPRIPSAPEDTNTNA